MAQSEETFDVLPNSGYISLEDLAKLTKMKKYNLRTALKPDCLIKLSSRHYLVDLAKLQVKWET